MPIFEAAQVLEMAVKIEKHGEAFYRAAVEKTEDPKIRELFQDLAEEERVHRRVFEGMMEAVDSAPQQMGDELREYASFLEVALDHAVFSGKDKALQMAEEADDRDAALRAAMGFEKDTMLFYYDLREMVGDRDREAISDIIQEEKKHLFRLVSIAA